MDRVIQIIKQASNPQEAKAELMAEGCCVQMGILTEASKLCRPEPRWILAYVPMVVSTQRNAIRPSLMRHRLMALSETNHQGIPST